MCVTPVKVTCECDLAFFTGRVLRFMDPRYDCPNTTATIVVSPNRTEQVLFLAVIIVVPQLC